MPPRNDHEEYLREIYRLTKENNKMLHAARRNAFIGRLFTLVFYAVLILGPLWFYSTYLSGTMNTILQDMQKIQGTSQQAQTQMNGFEQAWKQLQSKIPGFGTTSTTTHTQ